MRALSPWVRVTAAVAFAVALWVAGGHLAGFDAGLLCMAPAFFVALPLLAGRYPAERVLVGRASARPRRRAAARLLLRPPARLVPRGGLLVGHRLAGRAPPA
jgi:hypothetical protein